MQIATEKTGPRDATVIVCELRALLLDLAFWLIARGSMTRPEGHPETWLARDGFASEIVAQAREVDKGARAGSRVAPFRTLLRRREALFRELIAQMSRTSHAAYRATRRERAASDIVDREDADQDGISGLMRAVELFDASKGYKFQTFAQHWIQMSTRRAAQRLSRVRCPAQTSERKEKREAARRLLAVRPYSHFHDATSERSAGESNEGLGPDGQELRRKLSCEPQAEAAVELRQFRRRLNAALERLSPRNREIAIAHIYREETMLEIGDRLGVSRQAIGAAWLAIETTLKKALRGGALGTSR